VSDTNTMTEPTDFTRTIGQQVRWYRQCRELTQDALAAKLPAKVTRQRITDWENGYYRPSLRYLELIAEALGVEVSRFFDPPQQGRA
jgi:transcriptional regulator with XRE-family HTH domain